jgi:acyl-CoA thioester hydrolase
MYPQNVIGSSVRRWNLPPTDRFVAETTFRVRYAEVDAMHIVHHSQYIIYFEEGRSDFARQCGRPYSGFEEAGYYLLVSEIGARYHKPARYEDQITLRTWIAEMQSRGIAFNYEIVNTESGELLVNGFSKHICATHDGKIARIPEEWRDWGKA